MVGENKLWYYKCLLHNVLKSGFVKSQAFSSVDKINSTSFNSAESLVKALIVLVKLTHDDELQSQDALL